MSEKKVKEHSKDRVVEFISELLGDLDLNKKVYDAERTPEAWVGVAEEVGFKFTVDDLRTMGEEVLERQLPGENFIPEFVKLLCAPRRAQDGAIATGKATRKDIFSFSPWAINQVKTVILQGKYSGYYRPW